MTTQPTLTPAAFAAKWRGVTTTEKAGSDLKATYGQLLDYREDLENPPRLPLDGLSDVD